MVLKIIAGRFCTSWMFVKMMSSAGDGIIFTYPSVCGVFTSANVKNLG